MNNMIIRKIQIILLIVVLAGCAVNNLKQPDYAELVQILENENSDSLQVQDAVDQLIQRYTESRKVYDLAASEFYDRLYPVWRNDSLKVEIIQELLDKYPQTNWSRTMYQYLTYSLWNLKQEDRLIKILQDFRLAFPQDYIPFSQTARYYNLMDYEIITAELFAEKAFKLSRNYPKLEHYPPLEWELEERFAPIKTAANLAEIKLKLEKYEDAEELLLNVISNNQLGTEDENTLGQCYFLLAKAQNELYKKEAAIDAALLALTAGDSRNVYTPQADSLLRRMIAYKDLSEPEYQDFCRLYTAYQDVKFSDVTDEFGLGKIKAGRCAWADFNNDGFIDLLLNGSRLFQNKNGMKFEEITATAFKGKIKGNGGLWGDFDNDGDLDIITKDPEAFWQNNEGFFYKNIKEHSLRDNGISTEGMGIGDMNIDGILDIYIANYEFRDEETSLPQLDKFYKGNGDGSFSDVTDRAGLYTSTKPERAGRGVNMGDFDNDGDLDIYVSNYRLQPNFLWVNDGTGHFDDQALQKGIAGVEVDGWWGHTIGSEWGDLDNDGDLDLFCANLAHPRYLDFSNKSMYYINSGKPDWEFLDNRSDIGIRFEETHSEPCLADFNNDGFLDIYINCIYEGRRSFLYMSNGDGTYREVTYLAGVRHFNGWGNAAADIDNDGDIDLLAAGGTIQLFRNETEKVGNWLEVKVVGKDHVDAIGTRLKLSHDDLTLIRNSGW